MMMMMATGVGTNDGQESGRERGMRRAGGYMCLQLVRG